MATPRKAQREALAKQGRAQRVSKPGAPRGSYPTDTPGRAKSAKSRASHAERVGRISAATEKSIDARANKELGAKGSARRVKRK